jgi:hypothetical protein
VKNLTAHVVAKSSQHVKVRRRGSRGSCSAVLKSTEIHLLAIRSFKRDRLRGIASQWTASQLVNIITELGFWEEGCSSGCNMLSSVRVSGTAPTTHHIGYRRKRNTFTTFMITTYDGALVPMNCA